ncbi:hypothetical protein GCM10027168_28750 [Streptomyces capparidis]
MITHLSHGKRWQAWEERTARGGTRTQERGARHHGTLRRLSLVTRLSGERSRRGTADGGPLGAGGDRQAPSPARSGERDGARGRTGRWRARRAVGRRWAGRMAPEGFRARFSTGH